MYIYFQVHLRYIIGIFVDKVIWNITGAFTLSHTRKCFFSVGENISDFHCLFLKHEKKSFQDSGRHILTL